MCKNRNPPCPRRIGAEDYWGLFDWQTRRCPRKIFFSTYDNWCNSCPRNNILVRRLKRHDIFGFEIGIENVYYGSIRLGAARKLINGKLETEIFLSWRWKQKTKHRSFLYFSPLINQCYLIQIYQQQVFGQIFISHKHERVISQLS